MKDNNYIRRPEWNPAIRRHRDQIWFRRNRSAWDVASIICGDEVTQEEYTAAAKLLDSCQRYALASAAEWERENSSERYCNSKYHEAREKQLDARRERLQKRLARYGLRMENYGLYPTILDRDDRCMHLLHYFD